VLPQFIYESALAYVCASKGVTNTTYLTNENVQNVLPLAGELNITFHGRPTL